MLSRVAERLYWMGRYLERAEDTARLINVNTHSLLDLPKDMALGWEPLVFIMGAEEPFFARYPAAGETEVVRCMVADRDNPCSILTSLHQARENLRTTRDIVPREAWEKLNDLYQYAAAQCEQAIRRRSRFTFLTHVIDGCQLLTGLLAGTMSRGPGYDFARIGRNLERADMTTRIIDVRSASLLAHARDELVPFETIQWVSVLKSLSGHQMYRRHVHVRVNGEDVVSFLLQDRSFPRAVYHCLNEVQESLGKLPRHEVPRRHVARLKQQIGNAGVENVSREGLHDLIDALQIALGRLHDRIRATYFLGEAPAPRSDSMAA
ncbi:MAG: alpha-E domain-containing protein [Gammaproteobacteria bacterium]